MGFTFFYSSIFIKSDSIQTLLFLFVFLFFYERRAGMRWSTDSIDFFELNPFNPSRKNGAGAMEQCVARFVRMVYVRALRK